MHELQDITDGELVVAVQHVFSKGFGAFQLEADNLAVFDRMEGHGLVPDRVLASLDDGGFLLRPFSVSCLEDDDVRVAHAQARDGVAMNVALEQVEGDRVRFGQA